MDGLIIIIRRMICVRVWWCYHTDCLYYTTLLLLLLLLPLSSTDYLGDEAVEVGISGLLRVDVATAGVVASLIIQAGGHIGVLEESMGRRRAPRPEPVITTSGMVDEEALEASAILNQLADGVVATSVVVGGTLLPGVVCSG